MPDPLFLPAYEKFAAERGITNLHDLGAREAFTAATGLGALTADVGPGEVGALAAPDAARLVADAFTTQLQERAQQVRTALFGGQEDLNPDRPEDRAQMLHRFGASLATARPEAQELALSPDLRAEVLGRDVTRREAHRIEQGLGTSISGLLTQGIRAGGPGSGGVMSAPPGEESAHWPGEPFSGGFNFGSWNVGADFAGRPNRGAVTEGLLSFLQDRGLTESQARVVDFIGSTLVGQVPVVGNAIGVIRGLIDTFTGNRANWTEADRQTLEEALMGTHLSVPSYDRSFVTALNRALSGLDPTGPFGQAPDPGSLSGRTWGNALFNDPQSPYGFSFARTNDTNFGTRAGDVSGDPTGGNAPDGGGSPDFARGGLVRPGPPAGPTVEITAHEGEYVVPGKQTKKYLPLLEAIREDKPERIAGFMMTMVREIMAAKRPRAKRAA